MLRLYMVPMPETTIHKDSRPIPPHDDIWFARYALHVETIAVAVSPQPLPDLQLGFGAFAVDARHAVMPLCGSHFVSHGSSNCCSSSVVSTTI